MKPREPSRTARAAAEYRAAHQVLEQGRIFHDPLALRILGEQAEGTVPEAQQEPAKRAMRLFVAMRSRLAEDALAAAVEQGVHQLVVLGAGLDTYAYRGALVDRLRIFEVDHPATQEWKRERLAQAGIAVRASLSFAPVDFEHETLAEGLAAAGFDSTQRTFFSWLGVVPYLTEDTVFATLSFVGSLPGGAEVVFDYSDPPDSLSPELRSLHDQRAARVAAAGEEWLSYFQPDALHAKLASLGFSHIDDLGPTELVQRFFPGRGSSRRATGGHILRASTA
jgi:methyltransferase (TIGR00027 family)